MTTDSNDTERGPADHEAAVAAARGLAAKLRDRAAATEKRRTVTDESIADIQAQGLFHLSAPREFGGAQLGISAFLDTTAEIAAACGSTGWVYAVLAGHNWTVSLLPVAAQHEVFSDPDGLVASVIHLNSKPAMPVDGGYVIEDAQGRFCSGVDHAKWILVGTSVATGEDRTEPHYCLIPREDFVITDDWYAAGLRGTGSKSVAATRLFVPEHRVCSLTAATDATAPGIVHHDSQVYRMPFRLVQRLQLLGVPLGIARGTLAHCAGIYTQYHGSAGRDQHEDSRTAFLRLARASVELDAATNLVGRDAQTLDSLDNGTRQTETERVRILRDIAYAAQQCRKIVNGLFEASGARGLLDENVLQRSWRDANGAAAHIAFARDKVDLPYGRSMCGLAPGI